MTLLKQKQQILITNMYLRCKTLFILKLFSRRFVLVRYTYKVEDRRILVLFSNRFLQENPLIFQKCTFYFRFVLFTLCEYTQKLSNIEIHIMH